MSRILVIPDLHNRIQWVEPFLLSLEGRYDTILFLGDYFDSTNDTVEDAQASALWLKKSLTLSNRLHLCGNHDIAYRFPQYGVSGFTYKKYKAINEILSEEDWLRLSFVETIDGVFYSHGGIDASLLDGT